MRRNEGMRKPFVAGNWKMHLTSSGIEDLLNELKSSIGMIDEVDVAVCPPFPYLVEAAKLLKGMRILLGAQNMGWEEKGAFTGEVAAPMLIDVGCKLVILGHSERRHVFGEKDDVIRKKIRMALDSGLHPIVCIGETLEEREAGTTESVVESQIEGCIGTLSAEDMQRITIAYEPVWAIGT